MTSGAIQRSVPTRPLRSWWSPPIVMPKSATLSCPDSPSNRLGLFRSRCIMFATSWMYRMPRASCRAMLMNCTVSGVSRSAIHRLPPPMYSRTKQYLGGEMAAPRNDSTLGCRSFVSACSSRENSLRTSTGLVPASTMLSCRTFTATWWPSQMPEYVLPEAPRPSSRDRVSCSRGMSHVPFISMRCTSACSWAMVCAMEATAEIWCASWNRSTSLSRCRLAAFLMDSTRVFCINTSPFILALIRLNHFSGAMVARAA
mmetsp:Transcript_32075/g.90951  ORF Transcript_32075/g.90951 Transcript_32075/m.90951 type:complete len:257 (+) Transcript_32075:645-1415(+)